LGRLNFTAPNEGSGTDAILLAASIAAISEGTFAADNNATKLSFMTGASEAASEKMSLSSGGNLTLPTDGVVIAAGADSDVLLTHVADSGLTMSVTGNNVAQLSVTTDKDDANVGPYLNLTRYSASPAASDSGGIIQFNMENDNDQLWTAAQIYSVAVDVADGTEDGKLVINTMKAGTATAALTLSELGTATFGGNIVIPDDGTIGSASDTDAIAIRSDGNVGIGTAGSAGITLQVTGSTTDTVIYASGAGHGVYGLAGTSAGYVGVLGFAYDPSHYGYLGYSTYGLYATSIYTPGALYAASSNAAVKAFRIPHGLREGYDLIHSSIEGPQYDLIYRGKVELVNGQASIDIDSHYDMTQGTFEWLTKSDSVQTFTSNETGWDAVRSSFSGDTITIECQNSSSTDTISWMVIAERGDPSVVEGEGTDDEGNLIIERESEPPPPPPED